MFGRIGKTFVTFALAATLGLHWAFLQTIAWTGMVVSYSEHAPLREALVCTFDGKHLCPLCQAIAAAKKSERKTDLGWQMQKLEFPLLKEKLAFLAPCRFCLLPTINHFADSLTQQPPTPPPRGCFA